MWIVNCAKGGTTSKARQQKWTQAEFQFQKVKQRSRGKHWYYYVLYDEKCTLNSIIKITPQKVDIEEDNMERQELDEIARSEGGLVAVTKVIWPQATIMTTITA